MRNFEVSPDCILEKSSKSVAQELLKGSFVVGCDYENKQLVLENVFHYTSSQRRLEVYTLFPNKDNTKRLLKLETAFVLMDSNIVDGIVEVLNLGINGYDLWVIDKYKNLDTEKVYDKYGKCMSVA